MFFKGDMYNLRKEPDPSFDNNTQPDNTRKKCKTNPPVTIKEYEISYNAVLQYNENHKKKDRVKLPEFDPKEPHKYYKFDDRKELNKKDKKDKKEKKELKKDSIVDSNSKDVK